MNEGEGRRGTEIAKDNYNLKNCTVFKQPKNQKKIRIVYLEHTLNKRTDSSTYRETFTIFL